MPPKKGKKGGKKGGKGKGKKDEGAGDKEAGGTPEPSDKEVLLQAE